MRLTFIQPCIGRRGGERYLRTWQMEPLSLAQLSALTPPSVERRFYDDRFEAIPYDEPTDAAVLTVETYTARRSYEIASEYRRRGVPVVMGGFHPSLCPQEVERYADVAVAGEAEGVWAEILDDLAAGTPRRRYRAATRPAPAPVVADRSLYAHRRYLPVNLVELGRGCPHRCEFCAVQSMFDATRTVRDPAAVLAEVAALRRRHRLFFFVDDNFTGDVAFAKAFLRGLADLDVRWVGQVAVTAARDPELLRLMKASGCELVLVGLENRDLAVLGAMNKGINLAGDGVDGALDRFRAAGLRLYGTFVFGYPGDTAENIIATVDYAVDRGFFIGAFAHLVPFPGTPLYRRLAAEGRLRSEAWWVDPASRYGDVFFEPAGMTAEELRDRCQGARRRFYRWRSLLRRGFSRPNRESLWSLRAYWIMNLMHRGDQGQRMGHPLGDRNHRGGLIEVDR